MDTPLSYYNILEDRKKYGLTVLQNWEVSRDVRSVVENVARFEVEEIPTNPQRSLPSAPDVSQFVAPLRVLPTPPRTFPRIMPVALPSSSREFVRERTLASRSNATSSAFTSATSSTSLLIPIASSAASSRDIATSSSSGSSSKKRKRICTVCWDPQCSGSSRKELCSNKCGKCQRDDCTGRHVKKPEVGKRQFIQPYPCTNTDQ
ncbi:unnamed protein product [Mucor hiemalis]